MNSFYLDTSISWPLKHVHNDTISILFVLQSSKSDWIYKNVYSFFPSIDCFTCKRVPFWQKNNCSVFIYSLQDSLWSRRTVGVVYKHMETSRHNLYTCVIHSHKCVKTIEISLRNWFLMPICWAIREKKCFLS